MEPANLSSRRTQEWRWLLLNLLVLPGLGSIQGGRRRTGYCQLVLGGLGFLLTTAALITMGIRVVNALQNDAPLQLSRNVIGWATFGFVLFFVSWFWALATGIDLVRSLPEPPVHPA